MTQLSPPSIPSNVTDLISASSAIPGVCILSQSLGSVIESASSSIRSLAQTTAIGSIATQINAQMALVQTRLSSLTESIESVTESLQAELSGAMALLNTGADQFVARMEELQAQFPDVDMQEILDSISDGTFDIQNVPNMTNLGLLGDAGACSEGTPEAIESVVPAQAPPVLSATNLLAERYPRGSTLAEIRAESAARRAQHQVEMAAINAETARIEAAYAAGEDPFA